MVLAGGVSVSALLPQPGALSPRFRREAARVGDGVPPLPQALCLAAVLYLTLYFLCSYQYCPSLSP